jgi:hypothetical protein
METKPSFTYRSLFWPVLLIGAGVVWLLSNLGVIPQQNLCILFNLWPLILIIVGLDLLFGRRSPVIGGLIGLAAIGLVVFLLISGPSLGLAATGGQLVTDRFTVPLAGVENAKLYLNLSSEPAYVKSAAGNNLVDATLQHYGTNRSEVVGSGKNVVVTIDVQKQWGGCWFFGSGGNARWDIGIAPSVPLDVTLDAGSGMAEIDLSELQVTYLETNMGSGSTTIELPESVAKLTSTVDGGSGSLVITMGKVIDAEVTLDGGSGSIVLRLPADAAVRIEVLDSGSGSVAIPGRLTHVSGGEGDEGVWESAGYAGAAHKILIIVDGVGSGSIAIQ